MLLAYNAPSIVDGYHAGTAACVAFGNADMEAEDFEHAATHVRSINRSDLLVTAQVIAMVTHSLVVWDSASTAQRVYDYERALSTKEARGECLRAQLGGAGPGHGAAPDGFSAAVVTLADGAAPAAGMTGFGLHAPSAGWLAVHQPGEGGETTAVHYSSNTPQRVGVVSYEHWVILSGRATVVVDFLSTAAGPRAAGLPNSVLLDAKRLADESQPSPRT